MKIVSPDRIHYLNSKPLPCGGDIIYWMSREQRLDDNWSFLYALELSRKTSCEVRVIYTLSRLFIGETERSFDFTVRGLKEAESRAGNLNISFQILTGAEPHKLIRQAASEFGAAAVVCDFNPLRDFRLQQKKLGDELNVPVFEVDSRNIVPCRIVSDKQEFGAHTLRRKIEKLLPLYLVPFPSVEKVLAGLNYPGSHHAGVTDWDGLKAQFNPDSKTGAAVGIKPGFSAGMKTLRDFIEGCFDAYGADRNDPNKNAQSGLSPYLHFGQISSQTAALSAATVIGGVPLKGGFLDEIIVRRELSDNFCLYNPRYDEFEGFPAWAVHSLSLHSFDARERLYSTEEFERADTHDALWNAAQHQLVKTGKMHGYMRMYWAKKILEWSANASSAMRIAVYLNDKYSLDGRDPNGYAGCAWSIGGLHDRAWGERPVYGKVRYMSAEGCRRKFDVNKYIITHSPQNV